jgi:hypothetical protein
VGVDLGDQWSNYCILDLRGGNAGFDHAAPSEWSMILRVGGDEVIHVLLDVMYAKTPYT